VDLCHVIHLFYIFPLIIIFTVHTHGALQPVSGYTPCTFFLVVVIGCCGDLIFKPPSFTLVWTFWSLWNRIRRWNKEVEKLYKITLVPTQPSLRTFYILGLTTKFCDIYNLLEKIHLHGISTEKINDLLNHTPPMHTFPHYKRQPAGPVMMYQFWYWQHDSRSRWPLVFGGVILMDSTYCMNKYRMPFYSLAAVDSESHIGNQ